MTTYRFDLPERPRRMVKLPLDGRGYPVPWFVAWIDGKPDFRVIRQNGFVDAYNKKLCWLCGELMGRYGAFCVGPMCGINRVSAEPPAHLDCADYAARACPFMTRPLAVRNDRGLDEIPTRGPGGIMIKRNPGVVLVWVTRQWKAIRAPGGGALVRMGEPTALRFYREARPATRKEIMHSVDTGYPALVEMARQEGDAAQAELAACRARFEQLLPAEAPP